MTDASRAIVEPHGYEMFGLAVSSEIALPELQPVLDRSLTPDISIVVGRIDEAEQKGGVHRTDSGVLLVIEEVARFLVTDGARIVVEPVPAAAGANVRLFLLGSAMGMLIHQRGLLPLHGNAVEIEGRAFAFVGHSGAGKSTLAAWFHDHGLRILSDDVCVVRFDAAGRPTLSAGIPRLRLWREAIEASGRVTSAYDRSYAGDEAYDKYDVPVAAAATSRGALPLAAVYTLGRGDELNIVRLGPVDSAEAIFANTYRGAYLDQTATNAAHWTASLEIIRRVPVFELRRPWSLDQLGANGERIVAHARSLDGRPEG